MLSAPFPVPEGWLGVLPVPEHSHSRWIPAVCLTYGEQSLARRAPPGLGTALALRVPPPMESHQARHTVGWENGALPSQEL